MAKEIFWVTRARHELRPELEISLRYDPDMFAFLDVEIQKEIRIYNKSSGATVQLQYSSLTYELYFFLVPAQGRMVLKIVDGYMGVTSYDYTTLQQIGRDCFDGEGCGGLSKEDLQALGSPTWSLTT